MLHRLRHPSISFFMAGFVTPDLKKSSVYVEFCDRGSLENLLKAFGTKRLSAISDAEKPEVPERFIWHAFAGLCDGLAYLMGGRSYLSSDVEDYTTAPGWVPILHRDMKPDNVLIRSRGTVGTKRYFYCVLSDFGLACEDRQPGHAKEDPSQKYRAKCGTKTYWAPELLYNPYPKPPWPDLSDPHNNDHEKNPDLIYFPNPYKHTVKSDLWALGAMMYNLADCGPVSRNGKLEVSAAAHIQWDQKPPDVDWETFHEGTVSRKTLDISKLKRNRPYTGFLSDAIKCATRWELNKRPDPIRMVMGLKDLMTKSGFMQHIPKNHEHEQLPSWATRVHDYHSLPPLDPNSFPEN
jgi:serine/threonine protein kinase